KRGRQLTEIVVDDVRRIGAFLASSPAQGGWRVVVVDAADEMNRNAANALLKVLEEPGSNSLILLVCHQPGLLPATVRSRCRRVVLQPLADDVLDQLIVRYRPDIETGDRATLRALAEGSIGCALQLATADGLAAWRTLAATFAALADGDDRPLLAYAADPPAAGDAEAFRVTAHLLSWWLRTVARVCAAGTADGAAALSLPAPGDSARILQRLAAAATLDRWLKVWDKTQLLAGQAAAGNLDRKQALTTILLDLRREARAPSP
ncbi:MAG TPA: DNA polymerase III subunit delta', partial [Rhodospirillales bacterium]|nr:DNA polymerase III subunit delta' [Rhodospirillales bacterium]